MEHVIGFVGGRKKSRRRKVVMVVHEYIQTYFWEYKGMSI